MPKSTRQPIRPRGQPSVNPSAGRISIQGGASTSAMGDMGGKAYVSKDFAAGSAFEGLSSAFSALAGQARKAEAQAQARNTAEGRKAEAEAQRIEAEVKARQANIDNLSGAAAGLRFLAEVEERTRAGEFGLKEAEENALSILQGENPSSSFAKVFNQYALKGLEVAARNEYGRRQGEETETYLSAVRQSFRDIHSSYDPDRPEEYAQARTAVYESRKGLGISGEDLNELEMSSLVNQARKYASADPGKAQALLDLAEQKRPDGSPSLAASAKDGFATLEKLRDDVTKTILADSARERQEAEHVLKEGTRNNYADDLIAVSRLESPEAVKQWAAENVDSLSPAELKAKYGEYRGDMVAAVERAKGGQHGQGDDAAFADWSMKIERGEAEWEDIRLDSRLSDKQKAQVYGVLKGLTQKAALGYLPDSTLAVKLLGDLESAWPESVYGTPWTASRQIEPGRPPIVTPEGLFYQGELLKRLRKLDPELDVTQSNQKKQEILQDVRNEVVSGRLRYADHRGTLAEPAPQLKLSERVKEGYRLSDSEVAVLGKTLNGGGAGKIRDAFGLDYFSLDSQDQRRIAAEAQRQKAELDALRAETFFNGLHDPARLNAGLQDFSMTVMGLPTAEYDGWAERRREKEEAKRLAIAEPTQTEPIRDEKLNNALRTFSQEIMGLPVDTEDSEDSAEGMPKAKPETKPEGRSGGDDFFGNIGRAYGPSGMIITP